MTISRHTASLIVDGQRVEPTELELTLDESAAPYASLSATLPYEAGMGDTLDPRIVRRVEVSLRQDFGESDTLAALSANHEGDILAAFSNGEDVMPNAGFESGLDGWVAGGDSYAIAHSDEHAHTGSYSMELIDEGEGEIGLAEALTETPVPVGEGVRYQAQAWFYGTTDATEQVMSDPGLWIDFVDSAGEVVDTASGYVFGPTAGGWHRATATLPPNSDPNIVGVRVAVLASIDHRYSERVWVDDVKLGIARGSIMDITNQYGRPWNSFGMRASTTRRAALYLRSREIDHDTGTVSIQASSGESMLQDYALAETSSIAPGGNTVRDAVNLVLQRVLGVSVSTDTGNEVVEPDALPWEPGETAWSYLSSITGMAGLRLWCDEVGLWHLQDPETYFPPGHVSMGPERATLLQDSIGRDGAGFGDSAVVTYQWTDGNGEQQTRHDTFGPGGDKTIVQTVERPYPGRGFAQAIARKGLAQGRVVRISAVSDYDAEPMQPATLAVPDAPLQVGVVGAVQWRLPDDVMTVRTRDLMGITEDSWLYTAPGWTWTDTPPGLSWDDYKWSEI